MGVFLRKDGFYLPETVTSLNLAEGRFAEKLLDKVDEAEELEDVEEWVRKATERSEEAN